LLYSKIFKLEPVSRKADRQKVWVDEVGSEWATFLSPVMTVRVNTLMVNATR
jgi:hypothetical protein